MYANGLSKILDAILLCYKHQDKILSKQQEVDCLQQATLILKDHLDNRTYQEIQDVIEEKRLELSLFTAALTPSLSLLERCGVKSEEYEKKFKLISADHLRIGRNAYPHQWVSA